MNLLGHSPLPPTTEEQAAVQKSGGELLGEVMAFLQRFVALERDEEAHAIALWVLHTHALAAADSTPYLAITSPEKGCGKSQLLDVLKVLVASGWKIDGLPSEAVLFRKIERDRPAVLLDEVDRLFRSSKERVEPLVALLNGGNRRGATVPRCVGPNHDIHDFATFCPKALTGIDHRNWPDTIQDRSIIIPLQRVAPGACLDRWRPRRVEPEAERLRGQVSEWAEIHAARLGELEPDELDFVSPRAFDGWEPLLAIAEVCGGPWLERAIEAARVLSGETDADEDSIQTLALRAIRDHFGEEEGCFTRDLVARINEDESLPFGGWGDRGLTARRLAQIVGAYGVRPRTIRVDGEPGKGYRQEWFQEAWRRYLAEPPQGSESSGYTVTRSETEARQPHGKAEVTAVTDVTGNPERGPRNGSGPVADVVRLPMAGDRSALPEPPEAQAIYEHTMERWGELERLDPSKRLAGVPMFERLHDEFIAARGDGSRIAAASAALQAYLETSYEDAKAAA